MAVSLAGLLTSSFVLAAAAFLLFTTLFSKKRVNVAAQRMLPPSLPSLPVVGHLRLLGSLPHRTLRSLAVSYGPVMYLLFGRVPTVVACSAAAAEEVMKTRDLAFASRPRLFMVDRFYYGTGGIRFAPYGEHWRQARRVCVTHMFNPCRLVSFGRVRRQEVAALIERVRSAGAVVNLSDNLIIYSNTVISRVMFGDKDYRMDGDEGGARLRKVFAEIEELLGTVSMGEKVPWLWWVDVLTGLERKTRSAFEAMDGLLERVIADRRQRGVKGEEDCRDFVDVLLNANEIDTGGIKGIIVDMLAAATDSTFTTLEWAMGLLDASRLGPGSGRACRKLEPKRPSPDKMRKLQDEIRAAVGADSHVTEGHLPDLPYLKAVVKETLRLHPPTPLLLPRETLEDTTFLRAHGS